ncbi:MAG: hypothetical protein WAN65_20985 [Candidatus Sulfotelmatobacter sp.]
MPISQAQYPVFFAAVTADSTTAADNFLSLNATGQGFTPQGIIYLNQYNRDLALLGNPSFLPGGTYVVPAIFANLGLPLIALPSGTPIPPLSADLLSQLSVGGGMAPGVAANPPTPTTPSTSPATPKDLGSGGTGSYCDDFPDDPLCTLFNTQQDPGNQPIVVGPTSVVIDVTQGISATDVDGIVNGALGDLWDAVVGAVDAVIAEAVGAIQNALTALGNALKAAYAILSRLAGFILNMLKSLWQDVVKGIVAVLQDIKQLLDDLYKDVLAPIVNGIGNIRQALLDVYQRFIRPMLIVLQDLRKLLAILSLFHVSFAQKLDAKLTQLEAKITQPLFYLLSFVNGVANWINLIITAGYLLQKSVFLNSLQAYIGESLHLQINAMNPPPDPARVAATLAANTPPTAAQSAADFSQFISSDTGPVAAAIAVQIPLFDQYLSQGVS